MNHVLPAVASSELRLKVDTACNSLAEAANKKRTGSVRKPNPLQRRVAMLEEETDEPSLLSLDEMIVAANAAVPPRASQPAAATPRVRLPGASTGAHRAASALASMRRTS